jgi:hypothetical protein
MPRSGSGCGKLADQMPIGMYRARHPSSVKAPDDRGRGHSYVESAGSMERQFAEALERNRQRLSEQREELRRRAELRRVATDRDEQTKRRSSHAKPVSRVRSAGV